MAGSDEESSGQCLTDEQREFAGANIGLARSAAGKWQKKFPWFDEGEIYSLCCLALCKAAMKFDPARHFAFSSWVFCYANAEVISALRYRLAKRRNPSRSIVVPNHIMDSQEILIRRRYRF